MSGFSFPIECTHAGSGIVQVSPTFVPAAWNDITACNSLHVNHCVSTVGDYETAGVLSQLVAASFPLLRAAGRVDDRVDERGG